MKGVKLLLVDDEELIRLNLRALFEDIGFQVVEAANGREALEVFAVELPGIVVTDLRMPVMDGLTLIAELKNRAADVPIVVISGVGNIKDAIEAIRRGAWDYVTKPVQEADNLEIVLSRSLERARLLAENRAYREHLEQLIQERTADLRDSEIKYRTLFESANDAIFLLRDDRIVTCNAGACHLFGSTSAEMAGHTLLSFSPLQQPDGSFSSDRIASHLARAQAGESQFFEWMHCRHDAATFYAETSINRLDLHGTVYLQAIVRDVTERKSYEEQLYRQAKFDLLTGLPNRYLLTDRLSAILQAAHSKNDRVPLIFLDVDNFSSINDTLGHVLGDELLRQLAERLTKAAGEKMLLARFAGDDFVIVGEGIRTREDATDLVRKLRQQLAPPFRLAHTEVYVTVSTGIAFYPEDGATVESLVGNAEAAMYCARKQGVNALLFFSRDIGDNSGVKLSLGNRLHKALERDEFILHYQPQIDLATASVDSMEVLLRWKPGEETIFPAHFISVLEETGLIVPVGEWVLRRACQQLREWLDAGLSFRHMSVNVSGWQFRHGNLFRTIRSILDETGVDPRLLCLEVTESILMQDVEETFSILQRLNDIGVSLSIDDFGTGYSSLSYLRRMPIHELKIDRSFLLNLCQDQNCAAIVRTIIGMAQSLNLSVVAEGVETEEQLQFLSAERCRRVQGYFFSRPLPAEKFVAYVASSLPGREAGRN